MSAPPIAYAFAADEKISGGFVRMIGEIAVRADGLTRDSSAPIDELIHEGRLLIKRLRALLWFARPALGSAAYTRARTRLRRAAGLLSDHRDRAVMRQALEELARKASTHPRDRAAATSLIRGLAAPSAAGGKVETALRETFRRAMAMLGRSVDEIKRSARDRARWPSPAERVEKAIHSMRGAEKKARRTGDDTDFHAWRKKTKRLLYQLELTQALPGRRSARIMERVGKLQSTLGQYHDDVVVGERLRIEQPLPASARRILRLLAGRKAALRKKACKIADSLPQ